MNTKEAPHIPTHRPSLNEWQGMPNKSVLRWIERTPELGALVAFAVWLIVIAADTWIQL